jgi:hypothetical protein
VLRGMRERQHRERIRRAVPRSTCFAKRHAHDRLMSLPMIFGCGEREEG